jgi:hypothetical protein
VAAVGLASMVLLLGEEPTPKNDNSHNSRFSTGHHTCVHDQPAEKLTIQAELAIGVKHVLLYCDL